MYLGECIVSFTTGTGVHSLPVVFQATSIRRWCQAANCQWKILHPPEWCQIHRVSWTHMYVLESVNCSLKYSSSCTYWIYYTSHTAVSQNISTTIHCVFFCFSAFYRFHVKGEPRGASVYHWVGQPSPGNSSSSQCQPQVSNYRGMWSLCSSPLGLLLLVFLSFFWCLE